MGLSWQQGPLGTASVGRFQNRTRSPSRSTTSLFGSNPANTSRRTASTADSPTDEIATNSAT
jgi:hypothetical protein